MRQQAPLPDFQAYQTPEFTHAEVLEITGLTADTLLTWHKRGVVVGSEGSQAQGRGHRRKYSEFEVVRLAIMKHLAPTMALPMAAAGAAAASAMVFLVTQLAAYRETIEELEAMPGVRLLAYHDLAGTPRFDLVGDANFPGLEPLPSGGLAAWMRKTRVTIVTVLDINMITFTLYAAAEAVRMRRRARQR